MIRLRWLIAEFLYATAPKSYPAHIRLHLLKRAHYWKQKL